MISINPAEELKKVKTCEAATVSLRERWDNDWALIRLDSEEYKIPIEEGEWQGVVSNRAKAEAFKIMDYLCYARRKLWIPLTDEDRKGRKDVTLTEQLSNGCIWLADNMESGLPYQQDSQSALTFYRVVRGWSTLRYVLREEEDNLVSDFAAWDPRNTYWIPGKKRMTWVCYVRYATKDEILDEYPKWNGNVGIPSTDSELGSSLTPVYDVWAVEGDKESEEAVVIGNEYVKEPDKTELKYIPVRIKAGRAVPLISDGKHDDNIKFVGEPFLASNREAYIGESRLLSYQMTRAGQMAKAPVIIEFDSSKQALPPSMEKDPSVAGRTISLDTAKGQRFSDRLLPPSGPDIMTMLTMFQAMESIGGLSPVAWGQINQALPAQGIDILTHSTMDAIKPFKLGVESDYVWWAQDIARQFKNGNFSQHEIEGRNNAGNPYKVKIKPEDISDTLKFQCELVPDLLRDKAANLAWAVAVINAGLLSIETARDQSQIVVDTDLEGQKVAKEKARAELGVGKSEAMLALIRDFAKSQNSEDFFILLQAAKALAETTNPPQPGGNGGMPVKEENNLMAVPENIRRQQMMQGQGAMS